MGNFPATAKEPQILALKALLQTRDTHIKHVNLASFCAEASAIAPWISPDNS